MRAQELRSTFEPLAGLSDYQAAKVLNDRGVPAAGGGKWRAVQVQRVRDRQRRAA